MRASDIAEATGLQKATVYTHVRNVVNKLGVQTRTQAAAMAIQYSFLNPSDAPVRPVKPARGTPANSR
jgi:DNA-binding NarL/FixJ family response regulator